MTDSYVGRHALLDLYWPLHEASVCNAENSHIIMDAIERAVTNENATILSRHVNEFPGVEKAAGGFTGMFVLSESHASVHTWPEHALATIDVYMCGSCDAFACIDAIVEELEKAHYQPSNKVETRISRGQI